MLRLDEQQSRRKGLQDQTKESAAAPLPLLGVSQEHKAIQHCIYAVDLAQTHTSSLIVASVTLRS